MLPLNPKVSFYSVGLAIIVAGIFIISLGAAFYILNCFFDFSFVSPSSKVIGGLVVLGMGYLILELELMRKK